ncbi:PREDICTED: NAD kinase 2, mitochondrial [Dinoponera quadriceps]|uniref:NAD(+) kinase n=1 Tax=Dinoponera quadriceps TaxID=609295 RepID=A0A6P3YBM6_DINQU|nr:PREDICTED: NAD kinase 2, mitochondrial [Dinoponera quadriceps]
MRSLGFFRRSTTNTVQLLQLHSATVHKGPHVFIRNASSFVPRKVLIVTKLSRYHFEKVREPKLNKNQLRLKLLERGYDYNTMIASHTATKAVEDQVTETLEQMNVEYKIVNRTNLDQSLFTWADLILPIGGDGTFLLASNLIFNNKKPIMGINSYPEKSEGYLMLSARYTRNIPEIFKMLKAGHYNTLMRRRIRITLLGKEIWANPFHLHEKGRIVGTDRIPIEQESHEHNELPRERRLPWLALNEVFMGETLSARTSSLLVKLDEEEKYHKVRGSGLCVSTGTGSTSWYRSMHSLSHQTVREILELVDTQRQFSSDEVDKICTIFNSGLRFDAEDLKLCYSIRDMIVTNSVPVPKLMHPRGFCAKITVRSQCNDAALVIDGGIAVPFVYGTVAKVEIFPEDSLQTITLSD